MIPWLLIAGGALTGLVIISAHRIAVRRRRTPVPVGSQIHGDCFYLNEVLVADLYRGASDYDVVETTRNNQEGSVSAKLKIVHAGTGQKTETAKEIKYTEKIQPITMLRDVVTDYDKDAKIVDVDLNNRSLKPGAGLDRALERAYGREAARQPSARLSDLRGYVWVLGEYRTIGGIDQTITFSAPYGGTADPAGGPRVSVTCATEWMRPGHTVPQGPFPGRCFGRVLKWDAGELVIEPLAIFQQ
jgi:hypothetical protein